MPIIIDIEASGFGAHSYPIEVGVVKANGERFCSLIKPQADWTHWDDFAQSLHGISPELLAKKGRPVQEVCSELNQFLAGQTAYSDGWVVDQPWLIKLFHAARQKMQFSISPLEMLLNEGQMAVWHSTKDSLLADLNHQPRHRASHDAALIQDTFRVTRKLALEHRPFIQTAS
ncbi:3'-5' exonuclease [Paraglaciecola hydrolytica]|uniref:3'-5' exonuclease n=1 Tax=Paraglaciecola hydrolytica TaxID=1799789 RepID=UPI000AEE0AB5|nr:exonuclease domain-containing protein [Paraglaciecola hydrolytica]